MDILDQGLLLMILKIMTSVLIGLYCIFAVIVSNKVRSLSNMVFISSSFATSIVSTLATVHLIGSIMLFLISIVIIFI